MMRLPSRGSGYGTPRGLLGQIRLNDGPASRSVVGSDQSIHDPDGRAISYRA